MSETTVDQLATRASGTPADSPERRRLAVWCQEHRLPPTIGCSCWIRDHRDEETK